jgi:hypothetical protein
MAERLLVFPDGRGFAEELRALADGLEKLGTGYGGSFEYRVSFGGSHAVTVKCEWDPDSLRARADEFKRQLRRMRHLRPGAPLPPYPKKQTPYSAALANGFLLAGEHDNYQSYQELYGRDTSI